MQMTETEIELGDLRDDLEQKFKPIFDRYGYNGIELTDLQRELEVQGLLEHIPNHRRNELLIKADQDGDKTITYKEFSRMMTHDLTQQERRPFRRMLKATIVPIIPKSREKEFLAEYNCYPPPLFIPIISIAQIIVFIVYKLEMDSRGLTTTATDGYPRYSPLVYTPNRRYEIWRFLTYMLIHQGYMHIIFNMLFQMLYGLSLEVVHKWWRVGLVYLLGVLAGSLAHSVTDHEVCLVGASGGGYALIGAHVAAILINWKEMNYKCMDTEEMKESTCWVICRVILSAPVRLAIILILVVPDFALATYRRVSNPEQNKIGVTAHIGGFLAGIMMGLVLMRNITPLRWEKNLGWITLSIYLAFMAFCALFNYFYEGYPKTDWS